MRRPAMVLFWTALLSAALALALADCAKKRPRVAAPPPAPPPVGSSVRGIASWYGKPYDGRQAADGEIYDMEQMVAAHRTLPFQTMVRVRNLANGKTVDVRIVDRGPFVNNRIIDLSHAAARSLEMIGSGLAQVELTILSSPANAAQARFAVQVGAFRDRANADRMQHRMTTSYGSAKIILRQGDPPLWRVLAGSELSPEAAETLAQRIRHDQDLSSAFVVRLDP